ncbi:MAG: hypothetical protein RR653_14615, partial [Clostridia bacterium]
KHSNSNIEISNYVDLNTNHFVINNNYIIPPIVDSDFRTFKPLLRKQTNKEKTYNTINIYNPTNERVIEELKFTIGDENVEGFLKAPMQLHSLFLPAITLFAA